MPFYNRVTDPITSRASAAWEYTSQGVSNAAQNVRTRATNARDYVVNSVKDGWNDKIVGDLWDKQLKPLYNRSFKQMNKGDGVTMLGGCGLGAVVVKVGYAVLGTAILPLASMAAFAIVVGAALTINHRIVRTYSEDAWDILEIIRQKVHNLKPDTLDAPFQADQFTILKRRPDGSVPPEPKLLSEVKHKGQDLPGQIVSAAAVILALFTPLNNATETTYHYVAQDITELLKSLNGPNGTLANLRKPQTDGPKNIFKGYVDYMILKYPAATHAALNANLVLLKAEIEKIGTTLQNRATLDDFYAKVKTDPSMVNDRTALINDYMGLDRALQTPPPASERTKMIHAIEALMKKLVPYRPLPNLEDEDTPAPAPVPPTPVPPEPAPPLGGGTTPPGGGTTPPVVTPPPGTPGPGGVRIEVTPGT